MSLKDFAIYLTADAKKVEDTSAIRQPRMLRVPEVVELREERLVWKPDGNFAAKVVDEELIYEFANLTLKALQGVLTFAQTWGTLGLCEHGLPTSHNTGSTPVVNGATKCKPLGNEPVDVWHRLARLVRAVISLSHSLKEHRKGSDDDWLVLLEGAEEKHLPEDVAGGRILLERAVNLWLDLGGVRPRLRWGQEGVSLEPSDNHALFGTLALQLMSAVVGSDGVLICSACGACGPVKELGAMRLRRPKAGARFYCDDCQDYGAPQRHAAKAYRRRKASKRSPED